jgi:hypothetical protein
MVVARQRAPACQRQPPALGRPMCGPDVLRSHCPICRWCWIPPLATRAARAPSGQRRPVRPRGPALRRPRNPRLPDAAHRTAGVRTASCQRAGRPRPRLRVRPLPATRRHRPVRPARTLLLAEAPEDVRRTGANRDGGRPHDRTQEPLGRRHTARHQILRCASDRRAFFDSARDGGHAPPPPDRPGCIAGSAVAGAADSRSGARHTERRHRASSQVRPAVAVGIHCDTAAPPSREDAPRTCGRRCARGRGCGCGSGPLQPAPAGSAGAGARSGGPHLEAFPTQRDAAIVAASRRASLARASPVHRYARQELRHSIRRADEGRALKQPVPPVQQSGPLRADRSLPLDERAA